MTDAERPGVERPTNVAIARWLAKAAATRSELSNYEQQCAVEILSFLEREPPNITAALEEADDGISHAWRGNFVEERFEAWACAAIAALLRDARREGE